MNTFQYLFRSLYSSSISKRRLTDLKPLLHAEICTYKSKAEPDLEKTPWLITADEQFKALETAISNYEIQQGWKIFKNIKRLLILSMHEQARINHARTIFNEANSKIVAGSWRQKSIIELLGVNGNSGNPNPVTQENWVFNESVKTENIVKANEILDEYQDDFYEKNITLNKRIRILSFMAILAVSAFVLIGPKVGDFQPYSDTQSEVAGGTDKPPIESDVAPETNAHSPIENSSSTTNPAAGATKAEADTSSNMQDSQPGATKPDTQPQGQHEKGEQKGKSEGDEKQAKSASPKIPVHEHPRLLALLVILTGLIGAIVGGLLRIIQKEDNTAIPIYLFGNSILTARLVLATMASLAIYIFLGTGVLMFFSFKISFELLLAFSFAAGFSEHLVQKGVEMLTKEEMYKGSKGHPST